MNAKNVSDGEGFTKVKKRNLGDIVRVCRWTKNTLAMLAGLAARDGSHGRIAWWSENAEIDDDAPGGRSHRRCISKTTVKEKKDEGGRRCNHLRMKSAPSHHTNGFFSLTHVLYVYTLATASACAIERSRSIIRTCTSVNREKDQPQRGPCPGRCSSPCCVPRQNEREYKGGLRKVRST